MLGVEQIERRFRRTLSAQQVSLVRVVPGTTQDHSLYKSWTVAEEVKRVEKIEGGMEAKLTEGVSVEEEEEVAADDDRQAHKISTVSASEVHPQEAVTASGPDTMDALGFTRVGYWQNVIARTVASSRSGLAAKTLKLPELQPHQVADRRQPVSNKHARRLEDDAAVGGMRNPATVILKLPGWGRVGAILRKTMEDYMCARPDVVASVVKSIQEAKSHITDEAVDGLSTGWLAKLGRRLGHCDRGGGRPWWATQTGL